MAPMVHTGFRWIVYPFDFTYIASTDHGGVRHSNYSIERPRESAAAKKYNVISLLTSETPLARTRLVLPFALVRAIEFA